MSIFAMKITARQEQMAANMVTTKEFKQIYAVLASDSLTNYVMVEADDNGIVMHVLGETPHTHDPVESSGAIGTSGTAEVEHFLSPTPGMEGIVEGGIVEPIAGLFKGEKVRVQRIDETEDQTTVELYEATVPIPITVRGDQIRVLDSEER